VPFRESPLSVPTIRAICLPPTGCSVLILRTIAGDQRNITFTQSLRAKCNICASAYSRISKVTENWPRDHILCGRAAEI
jgi:hypothetical protein